MCYYKLDYYDVSLEILAVYLQAHPDSAIGVNLKACNHFRLYNGKAAEAELRLLIDKGVNIQGNEFFFAKLKLLRGCLITSKCVQDDEDLIGSSGYK